VETAPAIPANIRLGWKVFSVANKYSSLLRKLVNYDFKSFIALGPRGTKDILIVWTEQVMDRFRLGT
jgi:hypothetical protein